MSCWPLQRFETVCVLMLALLFILGCDRGYRPKMRQPVQGIRAEALHSPIVRGLPRTTTARVFRGSVSSLSIQDELIER